MSKVKFQPSVKVSRNEGESAKDFMKRVLADPRLLPEQRQTLEHDLQYSPGAFDEFIQGVWLEQVPISVN